MDRICGRCKKAPAHNAMGPPICLGCRVTPPGDPSRPIKTRRCRECGRRYKTRAGNLVCASCAHHLQKHPCSNCGVPIDKRAEVCRTCWGLLHRGEASPNWRGGGATMQAGYRLRACPGHPKAQGPTHYVREHVLVMEEVLGRYLLPGESVHHRNGVRDDNRPNNLELWVKTQPAGQRAADLLTWAREIIATYEPVEAVIAPRRKARS